MTISIIIIYFFRFCWTPESCGKFLEYFERFGNLFERFRTILKDCDRFWMSFEDFERISFFWKIDHLVRKSINKFDFFQWSYNESRGHSFKIEWVKGTFSISQERDDTNSMRMSDSTELQLSIKFHELPLQLTMNFHCNCTIIIFFEFFL